MIRIAVAQIDPIVGDFQGNLAKIKQAYERACAVKARLLITPELSLFGYPPHDLVDRPEIFERNEAAVAQAAEFTRGKDCALAVGAIFKNPNDRGRAALNAVTVIENGVRVYTQAKTLLPTYDVFDEARYFEPATETQPWICDGKRIGFAICEDLWGEDPTLGRRIYTRNPMDSYCVQKLDLLISCSASPYVQKKLHHRESLHGDVARKVGVPLLYVNQVGATDEILFDGASFATDAQGKLLGRLNVFETGFGVFDAKALAWEKGADLENEAPSDIEILKRGLTCGIHDYFARTGFTQAVIGLSGGIDSAVVATLATQALGAKNVLGVAMPAQHSSSHSLEDAEALAKNLGISFEVRPIKFLNATASRELAEARGGKLKDIALENLQSRLRGVILMTLANHYNALVITTGNKSELATGYCTLYGDMCGAIAPIGDLLKTRVYELAKHLNVHENTIPERTITKAPSAELKPGQVDQDTLPPYEILDELLTEYLEKGTPTRQIKQKLEPKFEKKGWFEEILKLIERSEFKRRQAAPVFKVSPKAFGLGRRIPIAKVWQS